MGHSVGAAHDPSVADYRATSPASPGRKSIFYISFGLSPSAPDYGGTSPV